MDSPKLATGDGCLQEFCLNRSKIKLFYYQKAKDSVFQDVKL